MTKVMVAHWGWLYLHVVLDWYTKKIIGYNLSWQSKTKDWLDARSEWHIHCCHIETTGTFFTKSDKQGIYEC